MSLLAWRVWLPLPWQGAALAGGACGVALVLLLDRDCLFYAGLSGALHGLWAGNAVLLMAAQRLPALSLQNNAIDSVTGRRSGALLVLLALVGKLLLQAGAAGPAFDAWLQIPVYQPAHWGGLGGGLVAAGLALAVRGAAASARRQRPPG